MDFLQTPVTDTIRPFRDSSLTVKRRWYPVPWGTPTLGFPTSFTSHLYMHSPWSATGVGEVYPPVLSYERRGTPDGLTYEHVCGTEEQFQLGALFDPSVNVLYDDEWIPLCCGREAVCVTQLCSQAQVGDRPAAQLTSYPVPHQEAADETPFALNQVALNQGEQDPAWPGFLTAFYPSGVLAPAGWSKAVVADDVGVMQFQEETFRIDDDNAVSLRTDASGITWTVEQGGVSGTMTLAIVAGVLTLSGTNFTVDLGLGTAAFEDVGFSGHTLPFLDGINTWSGSQLLAASSAGVQPFVSIALSFDDHSTAAPLRSYVTFATNTTVGFGFRHELGGKVGAVTNQNFHTHAGILTDATFATWKARSYFYIHGATIHEYMSAANLGAAPGIGFLGATPVPTQTGDIGAALVAFGLMSGTPDFAGNSATADLATEAEALLPGADINGVLFDGTADIEVRLPATNTAGQTVCAGFTITGATGVFQATGNTFTLPAAGTYLITGRIAGNLQCNANGYSTVYAKIRNNTDAADLANSETIIAGVWAANEYAQSTACFSAIVTVAASKTFELYAARAGANWVVSNIVSAADGRTVIDWVRLY